MNEDNGFQNLGSIFANRKQAIKPPAYQWQDLALRIIGELGIPGFKRNSVFKACKDHPKEFIERCLNDTKELCKIGERWKYFFKIVEGKDQKNGQ
ncbi:MAG: hypothetical protein WCV92_04130 [Candidatus Buchananbacteria bacterium]